ncbi:TatD related DNase [archaeon BMS3Abin16]|nr:TatD related DNase [archaeon BMS3Abin16]
MKLETITDNHMHIDPANGMGLEAAKRFKRAGGTCMFLVNKMSKDWGVTVTKAGDFTAIFEGTVELGQMIAEETGLAVFPVVGVHPAELVYLCARFGTVRALEISTGAVDIASGFVESGLAAALGEIGRPHYPVEPDVFEASNKLLEHALCVAKDLGCAIQLHTESASEKLFDDLSKMVKNTGIKPDKIVKHFSGPDTAMVQKRGIMPSVLSSTENIAAALKHNTGFLMESDYIDDNRRPGAVMGPKTVPRVTKKLVETGVLSLEDAARIHCDNIEKTYGFELP